MDIAETTKERIRTQGFCFWRCANLNNEVVAIVDKLDMSRYHQELYDKQILLLSRRNVNVVAKYTIEELNDLISDDGTPNLVIHELKKQGARIE